MILDKNALSAFADGEPTALTEIEKAARIAIPVIVLGEFLFGVAQSRYRAQYERRINQIPRTCQFLEVSADTAVSYAEIRLELKRAGTPIPANDTWRLCAGSTLSHS